MVPEWAIYSYILFILFIYIYFTFFLCHGADHLNVIQFLINANVYKTFFYVFT